MTTKPPIHYIYIYFVIALSFGSFKAFAFDPFGIDAASNELHSSVEALDKGADALPPELQKAIGTNITLLNADMRNMLGKIDDKTLPLLSETATTQLNHMADLTKSLTRSINHLAQRDLKTIDHDLMKRISQLQQGISVEVKALSDSLDQALNLTKDSAIYLEDHAGVVTVRVIDQTIQMLIRVAGILFLLVGILLLGLKLLSREKEISSQKILFAGILLAVYFAAAIFLAVKPIALAKLAPKSTITQKSVPCVSLKLQQQHIKLVESLGDQALLQSTVERMNAARKNCLGQKN